VNNIKQETYTDFLPIFNLYRAALKIVKNYDFQTSRLCWPPTET